MVSVGGLAAVIYTDTLQALVMVVGATVLTLIGKLSDCEFAYVNSFFNVSNFCGYCTIFQCS